MRFKRSDLDIIHGVELSSPHLTWIEHDVYGIARRIRDLDPGYFIMRNHLTGRFEVHHLENKRGTYGFTAFEELDYRTLLVCRESDVRLHGNTIYKNTVKRRRELEAKNQKDFSGRIHDASGELADKVSLAVQKDKLYDDYKRTHGWRPPG
jgi:hypothetical protein